MKHILVVFCLLAPVPLLAAPIHPMVPMFHFWDYEKSSGLIDKVAQTGATRVSFTMLLLSEIDPKFKVQNFGAVWPQPTGEGDPAFHLLDASLRSKIKAAYAVAFHRAVERHLEIAILPQLDASGTIQEWRNFFDFDPTQQIGDFSYESALLIPILEALEETVPSDHPVEMTLEGEMGCTLFTHPDAWSQILQRIRKRGKLSRFRIGISVNYEGVNGKILPDENQRTAMQMLIANSDFIGISCYAKTGNPPTSADFQNCVEAACKEFANLGCPIPESKPLRFTELGLGGGGFDKDWHLIVPGPDAKSLGKAAFFGTNDLAKNPWLDQARIAYRRLYYQSVMEFLRKQSSKWKVENAYLWSFGSFDVHGFTNSEFGDSEIATAIQRHNKIP